MLKIVDISYGGESGFNQAIELASDTLAGVKFIQEKKLIQRYFDEISQVITFTIFSMVASIGYGKVLFWRGRYLEGT